MAIRAGAIFTVLEIGRIYRELVLFIRDRETGEAKASVLFPIKDIISIQDSTGEMTYKPADDFHFESGSREIVVPAKSKIVTKTAANLRRPAGTQKYRLTHRDGNGENSLWQHARIPQHANVDNVLESRQ